VAVTFQLPSDRSLDLLGFAWSPLFEAALSWQPVVRPQRTPMHLPWARRARQLPADLLAEIRDLTTPFDCCIPGMFEVGFIGEHPEFEDELAAFAAVDDDVAVRELSIAYAGPRCRDHGTDPRVVHDPAYRELVFAGAADRGTLHLAELAFDDPAALRDRYVRMLERYWELAFADEWQRLLPKIEAEVMDGAHALVTGGASALVDELLPEGRWDPDAHGIVIDKDWEGSCDVAGRGRLSFVPTLYGWPRVLVELEPAWPLLIIVPLRQLRHPTRSQASEVEVVDGLRALGDATRLQVARLVAEHPRSTREVAELLSLSDSAVSRHLKILEAAGLVRGRRDGYFVLYQLESERIDVLGHALRGVLGLAQTGSGSLPRLPVSLARDRTV
jgi:DNA-binding transcriptional ArsR family regulator